MCTLLCYIVDGSDVAKLQAAEKYHGFIAYMLKI
jgi:hypothetical protein